MSKLIICAECDCPIRPGDRVEEREDGADICWDCYIDLYRQRDAEDAPYAWGDIQLDQAREDGRW